MTAADTAGARAPRSLLRRFAAELAYTGIRAVTVVTDVIPARYRFGHWQRVLGLLAMRRGMPAVPRPRAVASAIVGTAPTDGLAAADLRCLIVCGTLDTGGIEEIVATLATGLPGQGIEVAVACTAEGRIAGDLRRAGVDVTIVDTGDLERHIRTVQPDVVQLHRMDLGMMTALHAVASAHVVVFHAMESYLSAAEWAILADLLDGSATGVAVSGSVRDFVAERTGRDAVRVVVNGVEQAGSPSEGARARARARLGEAIGAEITASDVLVVSLQRYSDQKNAAGLVDAIGRAVGRDRRLRLVIAGSPDNWLEVRRADLLRRTHRESGRIHLLGDSDAAVLLEAGDVFALDSFAEGGPVSALEAVARGLPVVLSDVGFARDLVASDASLGRVVDRANADVSHASLAAQRRKRHQSNRDAFAAAVVAVASRVGRTPPVELPERFTREAMVVRHAAVLREAAAGGSQGSRSSV